MNPESIRLSVFNSVPCGMLVKAVRRKEGRETRFYPSLVHVPKTPWIESYVDREQTLGSLHLSSSGTAVVDPQAVHEEGRVSE